MKRIILLGLIVVLMLSLLPVAPAAALTDYGTVVGGWLRLRTAPSFDATIIDSYYTGTVVQILGTTGNWYNVKTPDNQAGYMYADYINLGGGGGGGTTAYVTSANGYGVRMRTGPSKGYRVLAVYDVGTQVTVLASGTIWSRIKVGTTVGYMMSEFLTSTPPGPTPTTPPSGDMATVWSSNGYGVRLRSGPGTNYSIIGLYSVGTRVSIITRGTTWDKILVGSRIGYMMNEFLIYDTPADPVATGISITAASASGGQGAVVDLDVDVSGTNLSSPAYTLEVTGNPGMAEIQNGNLHILGTATIGANIVVTATTTDEDSGGSHLTDTCTVTVIEGTVSSFSFDRSTASVTVLGSDAQVTIGYSIVGPPFISLSVPSSVSSYVSTTVDSTNKEITVSVLSTIPSGTEFIITGTTNAVGSGGTPLTDTVTISVVTDATLSAITLDPVSTSLSQGDTTDINATLTYTNGTVVDNVDISKYTLEITSGADYASITGKTLTAGIFSSLNDQTVTVKGTSTADTTKTDTCDIVIAANAVPSAPTLISVIPGNAQVRLNWSAPSGGATVSGYEAFYCTTFDGTKTQFGGTLASDARTVTVTGLTNGTTYYFWVRARNTTGPSEYSNYLTASPLVSVPDAPTGLTADSYANQSVTVSWTAPGYDGGAAVTNYLVYVDGSLVSAPTSTALSRTLTGLVNGSTYSITVKASNPAGDSAASAALSVTLPEVPDAPVLTDLTPGNQKVTATWSTPATNGSTISGYTLRHWDTATPSTVTTVTGVTSPYDVTSLTNGHTYAAEVIANSNMGDSAASNSLSATPSTIPSAPASLNATVASSTSVSLSWPDAADGGSAITEYTVYYDDSTGAVPFTRTNALTSTTETVTGLISGTLYTFTVYRRQRKRNEHSRGHRNRHAFLGKR